MTDLRRNVRILVGNSVFEDAVITINDNWLHIEFDADDLDNISIELDPDRDLEEVAAAIKGRPSVRRRSDV